MTSDLIARLRRRAALERGKAALERGKAADWGRVMVCTGVDMSRSEGVDAGHHANLALDLEEAADELSRTCETCQHRAVEPPDGLAWCCVMPDATPTGDVEEGTIGVANALCSVLGNGCRAWNPK